MEVILIMKCTFCGAELNDDIMFCTECGRAVEATPAEPAEAIVKSDKNPGKVPGIISLVLGIVSFVFPMSIVTFVSAIVAVILGNIASKKSLEAGYKNTTAKIGMILGIVEIVLEVLASLLLIAIVVLYILAFVILAGV